MHVTDTLEMMERAYDDWKEGRWSRAPYIDMLIPSQIDPTMAPDGKHYMSVFVQYCPYELADGAWNAEKRAGFGDTVIDTIARHSPNFKDLILHAEIRTPWDIENEVGLTEGNIFQGELTMDQLLFNRPVPGFAQYRSPVRGLYMCGSSTHPGGGVMGAPGANAARAVLKDLGRTADYERGSAYDCIVIGAGHNGLDLRRHAGARRARGAGAGGAGAGRRRGAHARIRTRASGVGLRASVHLMPAWLLEELELADHGLLWRASGCRPRAVGGRCAADSGGSGLACGGSRRGRRACSPGVRGQMQTLRAGAAAASRSGPAAARYRATGRTGSALAASAGRVRRLGRADMRELLRIGGMNVHDLLEEHFDSPLLKGALAFDAVLGTNFGPRSPGTVFTLLYRLAAGGRAGACAGAARGRCRCAQRGARAGRGRGWSRDPLRARRSSA